MDKRNDIEKCIITEAEKEEFNKRIMDWLSDENLEKAKGKTRQEIYSDFGNVLMPIAYIPIDYVSLLDAEIEDNRVYSGMGYFIDHAVNHHPNQAFLKVHGRNSPQRYNRYLGDTCQYRSEADRPYPCPKAPQHSSVKYTPAPCEEVR